MSSEIQSLNFEETGRILEKLYAKLKEYSNLKKEFKKQQEKILSDISAEIQSIHQSNIDNPPSKKSRVDTSINSQSKEQRDTSKRQDTNKDKKAAEMLLLTSLTDLRGLGEVPTPKALTTYDENLPVNYKYADTPKVNNDYNNEEYYNTEKNNKVFNDDDNNDNDDDNDDYDDYSIESE